MSHGSRQRQGGRGALALRRGADKASTRAMIEAEPPIVPRSAAAAKVLQLAVEALQRGQPVVVATVLARRGSAPSTPGQKLLLVGDAGAAGSVGGGAVELRTLQAMRALLGAPGAASRVERFELGASLGMCCGGSVEILLEPMAPAWQVLIVGAGHIGAALAPLLGELGFAVVWCDGREAVVEARDDAVAGELGAAPTAGAYPLCAEHDDPEVAAQLGSDRERMAALVMTHDHALDQQAIEWAIGERFALVGGVGSRAKAARTRTRLAAKGFGAADVERVRMPLGIDIGARSPCEIAVAIAGELVRWRAEALRQAQRAGSQSASGRPRLVAAGRGPGGATKA